MSGAASPLALDDLRVLELPGARPQYCGKLLADLGADVIKVEPPGGDASRSLGPFYQRVPHRERSLRFFYLNTNKRSVVLDLESAQGRDRFRRLARTADVILESFEPGTLRRLGLHDEALRRENPGLVLCSITGFGQSGPHAHYRAPDLVAVAMSGIMFLSGYPDDPPNWPHGDQGDYCAGIWGAIGILTALHHRHHTGEGQPVDVSVQEALGLNQETAMQTWDLRHELRGRFGEERMIPSFPSLEFPGFGTYECRDGHVMCMMAVLAGGGWQTVVEWMDSKGMAEDLGGEAWRPFIAGLGLRELVVELQGMGPEQRDEVVRQLARIDEVLRRFFRAHDKRDLYEEGQRLGLVLAPVNSPADLLESPQLRARGYFQDVPHPELGRTIAYPGPPYRHGETPWRIRRRPPLVAEHDAELKAGPTTSRAQGARPPARPQPSGPPAARASALEGIRVLDFGAVGVGPICAMILGHFGAQVIKIETATRPDPLRTAQPIAPGKDATNLNASGYFNNFNSNKLSLTLDLKTAAARDIVRKLVAVSDVVVENYTPGTLEKWGLGYEELRRIQPGIILARLPMAGATGPHRDFGGYGRIITPVSGLHFLSGFPHRKPVGIGTNYADFVVNPGHGATAILAALHHRERTGRGQEIEIAQTESTAAVIGPALLDQALHGETPERSGNRLPHAAPHGAYPCRGEERWLALAVFEDGEWNALCETAGHTEWAADPRFATLRARKENEDALDDAIGAWTRTQDADAAMERLQQVGVPAGVVQNARDLLERDPHLKARGYYAYLDHPETGTSAYDTPGARLLGTPAEVHSPAPLLGQHTETVLREILGLDDDAISELVIEGALQ